MSDKQMTPTFTTTGRVRFMSEQTIHSEDAMIEELCKALEDLIAAANGCFEFGLYPDEMEALENAKRVLEKVRS